MDGIGPLRRDRSENEVDIYIGTVGRGVWRITVKLAIGNEQTSVGIGAAVAVAVVDDITTATITGTLTGGDDVTLAAATTHLLEVSSETGAKGGDVAITPSVAIALSNVTTRATVNAAAGRTSHLRPDARLIGNTDASTRNATPSPRAVKT